MRWPMLILATTFFVSSYAGAVFEISPATLSKLFLTSGSGLLLSVSPTGKVEDQFTAIATRLRELSSLHVLRLAVVNCATDRATCARFGLRRDSTAPVLCAWHMPGSQQSRRERGLSIGAIAVDSTGTVHMRAAGEDERSVYQLLGASADDGTKRVLLQRVAADATSLRPFQEKPKDAIMPVLVESNFIGELELERLSSTWSANGDLGGGGERGFPWIYAPEIEPGFAEVDAFVERKDFRPQQRRYSDAYAGGT